MASRKKNYSTKQVIENLELWQSLTKEEQAYLEENIEFISYKKNAIIYSDGEEPTKLLGVLNGFEHSYSGTKISSSPSQSSDNICSIWASHSFSVIVYLGFL
jgi:hypothetical protein